MNTTQEPRLIGNVVHFSKVVTRTLTLTRLELHVIQRGTHDEAVLALSASRPAMQQDDLESIVVTVKGPRRSVPSLIKATPQKAKASK